MKHFKNGYRFENIIFLTFPFTSKTILAMLKVAIKKKIDKHGTQTFNFN